MDSVRGFTRDMLSYDDEDLDSEIGYSLDPVILVRSGFCNAAEAYAEWPRSPFFARRIDTIDVMQGIKKVQGAATDEGAESDEDGDNTEEEDFFGGDVECGSGDDEFDFTDNFAYRSW